MILRADDPNPPKFWTYDESGALQLVEVTGEMQKRAGDVDPARQR